MIIRYNELPYDHEQPPISEKTLDDLCQLFRRHHAHHLFGIHLIHRHFQTSDNHVMLGSKMNGNLWWTKPTSISAVDMSSLHGHIYVVSLDRGLFPYEYREGSSPKQVSQVDSTFYQELAEYLIQQQLHNVLGLEVLENFQGAGKRMLEIVIQDHSTIMMEEEYASSLETLKITGWMISQDTDGILSLRGNEGHSRPRGGQHVIFTDGKLLQTNEDMMAFLEARGIKSSLVSEK